MPRSSYNTHRCILRLHSPLLISYDSQWFRSSSRWSSGHRACLSSHPLSSLANQQQQPSVVALHDIDDALRTPAHRYPPLSAFGRAISPPLSSLRRASHITYDAAFIPLVSSRRTLASLTSTTARSSRLCLRRHEDNTERIVSPTDDIDGHFATVVHPQQEALCHRKSPPSQSHYRGA